MTTIVWNTHLWNHCFTLDWGSFGKTIWTSLIERRMRLDCIVLLIIWSFSKNIFVTLTHFWVSSSYRFNWPFLFNRFLCSYTMTCIYNEWRALWCSHLLSRSTAWWTPSRPGWFWHWRCHQQLLTSIFKQSNFMFTAFTSKAGSKYWNVLSSYHWAYFWLLCCFNYFTITRLSTWNAMSMSLALRVKPLPIFLRHVMIT